jgi:segregation and condensation protein B
VLISLQRLRLKSRLSRAAVETLTIVAYRQPISRPEIEQLRGVGTESVLAHLLERRLIRVVGRKETPGRPVLYGTTRQFLEHFGLRDLEDLPPFERPAGAPEEASLASAAGEVAEESAALAEAEPGDAGLVADAHPEGVGEERGLSSPA